LRAGYFSKAKKSKKKQPLPSATKNKNRNQKKKPIYSKAKLKSTTKNLNRESIPFWRESAIKRGSEKGKGFLAQKWKKTTLKSQIKTKLKPKNDKNSNRKSDAFRFAKKSI
jgi:hypothetical protein